MRIVQVRPQSNWVLLIVAEDGRMGKFDVRPYLADEADYRRRHDSGRLPDDVDRPRRRIQSFDAAAP